ncbi:hypothetical protein [Gracilibacillus dipsosauri]|uniref:DUF4181 domain-containing protein n=1 Tax=Gracilibacillus dipsosauri TaxID=178340 RepID=A0A317KXW9_9BACI|nr:hypothetical protein [Gracilibacillus dipsosauri]PWU67954.1 hypothetical protein DLJ74_12685 [Gracilibacillus dipsosauri]
MENKRWIHNLFGPKYEGLKLIIFNAIWLLLYTIFWSIEIQYNPLLLTLLCMSSLLLVYLLLKGKMKGLKKLEVISSVGMIAVWITALLMIIMGYS